VARFQVPDTPVGVQFAWVLDQINGSARAVSEEEIAAHFSPEFLAQVPPPDLIAVLLDLAEAGPYTLTEFTADARPGAAAVLAAPAGRLTVEMAVARDPPHGITLLLFQPVPG